MSLLDDMRAADHDRELLRRVPLFRKLDDAQIDALAQIARPRRFARDETIMREGEAGDAMYVLVAGRVRVSKLVSLLVAPHEATETQKILARIDGTSQPFGDMALIDDGERSATVIAETDCETLEFRAADFRRVAERDPTIGYRVTGELASVLADRLRKANRDILKLTTALSLALTEQ